MRRLLLSAVAAAALATPAFAHQCPAMAAMAEDALAQSTADQATKDQIAALIAEGMELHEAGDHDASVAKLGEALTMLGVES